MIKIYGASDDLIEVEGDVPGCDEYNEEDATFVLLGYNSQRTRVRYRYGKDGLWEATISPFAEDCAGLFVTVQCGGYTPIVEVDALTVIHEVSSQP